jgi:hypothetical protein
MQPSPIRLWFFRFAVPFYSSLGMFRQVDLSRALLGL